jgi:phage shock protein E
MLGFGSKVDRHTKTPAEVKDLHDRDQITLVDVREAGEWADVRIGGALNIPLSQFRDLASTIPDGKPVVFYCVSGGRSGQAVALCRTLGLAHVTHMAGGIAAWRADGLPLTR